ncbi:SRPBCC family protein [Mycobacteroides salmoniphilum]|uniref:SRPBCC family protein n=1 Tax=Mycobacteroides salmoniphilum TaxID=404941 RepID=UPI003565B4A2
MTVHIVVSQVMPASCERTFDLIHDYGRRLEWDTLLRRASVEGLKADGGIGVGSVAVCTARWILGGYSFRTRYVTFKPPHLAAITLESKPPFFTKWAASLRHESIDSDDTDVATDHREDMSLATYTMTFACRPAFIEPLAERIFKRETENRLVALANFLQHDV